MTIFGESAGSTAVMTHMLSPASAGLFHRVIAQSGTPISAYTRSDRKPAFYARLVLLSEAQPTDQEEESVVGGPFFIFPCTQNFLGCEKEKLCLKRGVKRQKLCLKRGVTGQKLCLKRGMKRQKLCLKKGGEGKNFVSKGVRKDKNCAH